MMKQVVTASFVAMLLLSGSASWGQRTQTRLTDAWRFTLGNPEYAADPSHDDSSWMKVRVPHDWAIAGPFDPNGRGDTGKLPWSGQGWYRRAFTLDPAAKGQRVYLDFDGVMAFPKVYINGQLAGQWDYGYTGFRIDATPFVHFDKPNTLAVFVDTTKHVSRWYPGAGIYRKVALVTCDPVHVTRGGVHITTPKVDDARAEVHVSCEAVNHTDKPQNVSVHVSLRDREGREVVSSREPLKLDANNTAECNQTLTVPNPQRWDVGKPYLYTVVVQVQRDGRTCDEVEQRFGVRTFEFTADDGFHLNGRRVQLHGVNLHHDQGPLGAAFSRAAASRQLRIMRDMGVNALRTSHNPSAPEMLDLCDEMGMLVIDELFDKWDGTADLLDRGQFNPFMQRQVAEFVRRDRNHPSVVTWSICNENGDVLFNYHGDAIEKVAYVTDLFKQHDPTRQVGMGINQPDSVKPDKHMLDPLDMTGWNYAAKYHAGRKRYPHKPLIYTESASALSTRGFYQLPLVESKTQFDDAVHQVDSYDRNSARWADIPDVDLRRMQTDRYVAGEFIWTGIDYLGEPTPFNDEWAKKMKLPATRTSRSSYFGAVDLAGLPKDRFYIYRSVWNPEAVTVHILPHWNWPDRIGKNVPVYVYTNGDSAELFLNGKSLGRRTKLVPDTPLNDKDYYAVTAQYRLMWNDVIYQPGELHAVAYKGGRKIGQAVVKTANKPAALRLMPESDSLIADGDDLAYIQVQALDAAGVPCPLADDLVHFEIDGPAGLAGVGNGDPRSYESFVVPQRHLFYGKAVLIVRSVRGGIGPVRITATADGLQTTTIELQAIAPKP